MTTYLNHIGKFSLDKIANLTNQMLAQNLSDDLMKSDFVNSTIQQVITVVTTCLKGEVGIKVNNIILNDPTLFLQLLDYHTLSNLNADNPLVKFLNGEKVDCSLGVDRNSTTLDRSKITVGNKGLSSEIRIFINRHTEYGITHLDECIHRQKTIDTLDYYNIRIPIGNPHPPKHGKISTRLNSWPQSYALLVGVTELNVSLQ